MTPRGVAAAVAVAEMVSRELDEDYVGLWKIAWHLRRKLSDAPDKRILESGEAVLRGLAESGVAIGDLSETTGIFAPWPGPGAIERAMREWTSLGRDPNIGEIAWLARQW